MKLSEYREKIEKANGKRVQTARAVQKLLDTLRDGGVWDGPSGRDLLKAHADSTTEVLRLMNEVCIRLRKIGLYAEEKKVRAEMIPMQRERNALEDQIKIFDREKANGQS